jgi:LacI family transcriptional regulator
VLANTSPFFPKSQHNIEKIIMKNIPVIMIERPMDIFGVDKVFINDIEGSSMAANVFLSHGHRRIAFIGVDRPQRVESERYNGFRQTIEKNGVELAPKDIVFAKDYSVEGGYDAAQCLYERYAESERAEMPTAYFVSCDILACGVLQFLYKKRIRVPDEVSIIGYDNTTSASCAPQISTIAMPFDEIGKSALALFLERKNQQRLSGKSVELSPYFVDRQSVKDMNK